MKKTLLAGLITGLFSMSAMAFSTFTIKDIRVEGIQRTEAGAVFGYLPVKVGDQMTDEKSAEAIKSLFATGFFKDVRIEVEGDVLVVTVEERPAIAQIDFTGMKEFDKDTIKKALRDIGIAESRIFDRAALERAEQELKRQYLSRGKYAAQVTTTVTPLERNRVGISFSVEEGEPTKIKAISIVGAETYPEKDLLALFELRTPGWFTWFTKTDQYSRQKLAADLEKLRSYYMNRGYLEFNVDSTQVSMSADKKDMFVTVNITEGPQYHVSSVKLAGNLMLTEAELTKLVQLKAGDLFSREALNETTKRITDRLGAEGYAFANVNAAPEIDKQKKMVAFTVFIDPGKRAYVNRINISGNTKTRDEVIRREMRQMEAGWFDSEAVRRSKERVDRLGYFSDVTIETPPVPGTADQVDVNVNVTERPTGSLMLGAGFSQAENLILSASIAQNNIFGSGKYMALMVNTGSINKVISLNYTDPYFTVDGISQGFDVYQRVVNPMTLSYKYKTDSVGGNMRFGFPIGEKESIHLGVGADVTKVTTYAGESPQRYLDFVNEFGETNLTVPLTLGWVSDGKDSFLSPTKGVFQRLNSELGSPAGKLHYVKTTYQLQNFIPVSKSFTWMLNGELGVAQGIAGQSVPFYKNFYAGGIGSVRGYRTASLGPTDTVYTDSRVGGTRQTIFNSEVLYNLPGYDKTLRLGWFMDAGQVFGPDQDIKASELRKSTGLSMAWISPVGPLKFSIAQPIGATDEDKTERFQFQLGSTF